MKYVEDKMFELSCKQADVRLCGCKETSNKEHIIICNITFPAICVHLVVTVNAIDNVDVPGHETHALTLETVATTTPHVHTCHQSQLALQGVQIYYIIFRFLRKNLLSSRFIFAILIFF